MPAPKPSSSTGRILLLFAAVLAMAAAVWGVARVQRIADDRAFDESIAAQRMVTGMVDQETGLRGFALTREESFLGPFKRGMSDFERAADRARRVVEDPEERSELAAELQVASRWRELAEQEIAVLRANRSRPLDRERAVERKKVFDEFRALNARFQRALDDDRAAERGRAGITSVVVILLLALLFGGVGYVAIERQARRERARRVEAHRYRETQAEFAETMQMMRDETDAHGLVKHHLERSLDEADVVVLNRNNSVSRLLAATPVPEDSQLALDLVDARARQLPGRAPRARVPPGRRGVAPDGVRALWQVRRRGHLRAVARERRGDRLGARALR